MAFSSSQQSFIDQMTPYVNEWSKQSGIPASVLLAIMASESNYGNAPSLFGMKGSGTAGSQNLATQEVVNGKKVNTSDQFAAYANPNDAFKAFMELISTAPRYADAWNQYQQTGNWQSLLQGINKAGYATDPNWANFIANFSKQFAPQVQSNAKAPTQNVSKPVAAPAATAQDTQKDAASQQQFGKNYADLTPVQKYLIDSQNGVGATGQPETLYTIDSIKALGGKLSSSGNTYELRPNGKNGPIIYFPLGYDASGKATGMVGAPITYPQGGGNTPVPYTGPLPAGLRAVQGGAAAPATGGGAAPKAGGTPPAAGPNASQVPLRGNTPITTDLEGRPLYGSTTPTFDGVGGGLGSVFDALNRTGGPVSFMPGGGPSNGGPYSLANADERAALAGTRPSPLADAYHNAVYRTGIERGYDSLGLTFNGTDWVLPTAPTGQFTQTTQPAAAPGGEVAQSSVPTTGGGATLANGQQAGGGGGGALGGVHITPPSLSGGAGLLGKGADLLGDAIGIGGGGANVNGFTANGAVSGQPQASAAASPAGAPSQFTQATGNIPTATAEVSGAGNGNTGGAGGAQAAGSPGQFTATVAPGLDVGNAYAHGTAGAVSQSGGSGEATPDYANPLNAPPEGIMAGGLAGGLGGIAGRSDAANAMWKRQQDLGGGGGNNMYPMNPDDLAWVGSLPGVSGFANGGQVQTGTGNPVGIFDLLTGRPIAIAGEAGPETVRVTPMRRGGTVNAGRQFTQTRMPGDMPFLAAGGAEFAVGQGVPELGVGFSGPKQMTGFNSLSYYSRPGTQLNPWPVPMEAGNYGGGSSSGGGSGKGSVNALLTGLTSLLGGSTGPKLPPHVKAFFPNENGAVNYIDTRTGSTSGNPYTLEGYTPSDTSTTGQFVAHALRPGGRMNPFNADYYQLADGGEFTVGGNDPSRTVFTETGYPNAGMMLSPEYQGMLRAMSSLTPTSGSMTQDQMDKSINSMLEGLGMGPSQAMGNNRLRASLSERLGLSPRAGAAMGILTGAAA